MILKLFILRLVAFINVYNITVCRELGGGFSGICLSEADIAELWRLHYEVNTLFTGYSVLNLNTQESNLGDLQRIFPAKGYSHVYHQYFSSGLSKVDELAAKWADL